MNGTYTAMAVKKDRRNNIKLVHRESRLLLVITAKLYEAFRTTSRFRLRERYEVVLQKCCTCP